MFDTAIVVEKLIERIGQEEYSNRLYRIADILSNIHETDFPEGEGVEDLVAEMVERKLRNHKAQIKNADILEGSDLLSINEDVVSDSSPQIKDIRSFDTIHAPSQKRVRSVQDRIALLNEIEEELKSNPKAVLTQMKFGGKGNQTLNDFLSDIAGKSVNKHSDYVLNKIAEIRKLSREHYKQSTKTDELRRTITKEDIKNLDCREICDKYGWDFGNGSIRMFISRLKRKQA